MAGRLPLSAMLSQTFVAFTMGCDNEFEHRMPHRTTRRRQCAHIAIEISHGPAAPPALLSRPLVAFTMEVERATGLSPVLGANVVRVLDDSGVPARRLSALTGLADMGIENSLSALGRRGYVAVGRDPAGGRARVARLTDEGVRVRTAYDAGVASVERAWGWDAVRAALEALVGSGAAPDSPLLDGLTPYRDGWRAQVPSPQTLPHYPFVSHRGGFPDGS